jgi:hypothetical protein
VVLTNQVNSGHGPDISKQATTLLKQHSEKLQERLSDIGPGFLFDRTDKVLLKKGMMMTL